MTDDDLFNATVPVLAHYVQQSLKVLAKVPDEQEVALQAVLTEGGFTAARQIWAAQFFALRGVFPVMERPRPQLPGGAGSKAEVITHGRAVADTLQSLTAADFAGALGRKVSHTAGQADLTQEADDYLLRFILPNMMFHLTTGYSILRLNGVDLGKADFDGLHYYEPGFSF